MKNIRHPNIVELIGVCWDDLLFGCLLEYVDNGTIQDWLKKDRANPTAKKITWKDQLLKIMTECALGVQYLHQARYYDEAEKTFKNCIIHRDLKPDNMLITRDWTLKLTDFGEARAEELNQTMTAIGTPIFVAPEIMISGRYSNKVDSYSFGDCLVNCIRSEETIIKYYLNGLRRSLKKKDLRGIGFAILTKRINERGWRPTLPKSLYKSLKKLIRDCWHNDPDKRPTFDEIVKRLLNEVNIEIELKKEPIFICDFEHPENNDKDYDENNDDQNDKENDVDADILNMQIRLETVEKEKEILEIEMSKTKKMLRDGQIKISEDVKKEEEKIVVPDFMKDLLAER